MKKIEEKNQRAEKNQSIEAWYVTPHRRRSLEAPRKMLQLRMLATPKSCLQIVQKDRTKKYTQWNEEVENDQHGRWLLGSDLEERASQTLAVIYFSHLFIRLLNQDAGAELRLSLNKNDFEASPSRFRSEGVIVLLSSFCCFTELTELT